MIIELINTGSELMLGRVLNTHQQWICRQLSDAGLEVTRQVAVPDTSEAIEEAVREALGRADWVITTGGLGPTSDDLTREKVALLLGRSLREDPKVLARIQEFYRERKRPQPQGVEVQALVPEGGRVLDNPHGTAPGLLVEIEPNPFRPGGAKSRLAMLPGPPRELRPMLREILLPLLRQDSVGAGGYSCRTLRSTGIGESVVEERLKEDLDPLVRRGLVVGYCARPGEVDIRFAARGEGADLLVGEACELAARRVGDYLYGTDDQLLEGVVVAGLTGRGLTLAVAESCTGGLLGSRITDVPGASRVFLGGWITYSNQAKLEQLGVAADLLERHGAVSEPVARSMAESARSRSRADYALAITGIAGPEGGTADKPVGTVYIALAGPGGTAVRSARNPWDRQTFKHVTTQQALELLRREAGLGSPAVPGAMPPKG